MTDPVPVLIITGPVGVGKTAAASEVSALLARAAVPHALVDLDALRACYPRPPHDPFHIALAMRNLTDIWANFRACGATHLVVADVLESRDELARYRAAIPGGESIVVRLQARPETLRARIRRREIGSGLAWHLDRAIELAALMDARAVEDYLIVTDDKSIRDVAEEIVALTGFGQ